MSAATDTRAGASFGAHRQVEETRERFMREIVARVPLERIVEVHCFTPIRQGGVETGVAVVAAMPAPAPEPAPPEPLAEPPAEPIAKRGRRVVAPEPAPPPIAATAIAGVVCDPTEDAAGPAPSGDESPAGDDSPYAATQPDAESIVEGETLAATDTVGAVEESAPVEQVDAVAPEVPPDSPPDSSPDPAEPPAPSLQAILTEPIPVDVDIEPGARTPWPRHTIFAARYRLTLKGPERGRWDVDVVEEADAPLVTVEAVVRGVQRRAGDAAGPERLTRADVEAAVARAPGAGIGPAGVRAVTR